MPAGREPERERWERRLTCHHRGRAGAAGASTQRPELKPAQSRGGRATQVRGPGGRGAAEPEAGWLGPWTEPQLEADVQLRVRLKLVVE